MTLRVVVADDHEAVREGLRWMLKADGAVEVVAEAADGAQVLALLDKIECDAVLLDLTMPGVGGLEVLRALRQRPSPPAVVVLTMHDDAGHVDRALAAGASGYVLKSASRDEIIRALTAAVSGGAYVQPALAKGLIARHVTFEREEAESVALSPRQLELLREIANGATNKQLAHRLRISEATVKGYLKDLYQRLGVPSRAAAVAYAMRAGLVK